MTPGSVFFDKNFHFNDGNDGKKLFIVLGSKEGLIIVVKTTSQHYGRGITYGCQPNDRFHNFYLPNNSCYLKKSTWVCLDDFYELKQSELLQKRFTGIVNHICDIAPEITRELQLCSILSQDITNKQEAIIKKSIIN